MVKGVSVQSINIQGLVPEFFQVDVKHIVRNTHACSSVDRDARNEYETYTSYII